MDDQRKDHIDPEGPLQRNRPKPLQTHNLPTDDVERIYGTNKGRDLLLAKKPRIVPWGTERILWRIQRRVAFYIDQHILNKSKTRRKNLAIAWVDYKKAYDMSPKAG